MSEMKKSDLAPTAPAPAKRVTKLLTKLYDKPGAQWLDPCAGVGKYADAFYRWMPDGRRDWCEVRRGRDFLDYDKRAFFALTNPPWTAYLFAAIRDHAFGLCEHVAFLVMARSALGLRKHNEAARRAGFGRRTLINIGKYHIPGHRTPSMTEGGLQVVVIHWQRGYVGPLRQFDFSVGGDNP